MPTTTTAIAAAVLLAAVLHATWNALAHAIADKLVAVTVLSVAFVVFGAAALPWVGVPPRASWPYLGASVCVHVLYNVALMRSYRLGAFNQVYPLARGMSPWVVAIVAALVVGERLGAVGLAGVAVVSVGLGCLVFARGLPHRDELPALAAAATTGLLIATYTVLDGLGVRASEAPFAYAAWLFLLHGGVLVAWAAHRRGPALLADLRVNWRTGLAAGSCAVVAYGIVLWAQSRGTLATVAALRETSVIVGAVIGAVVFREPFGRWRTVATVVVAAGIALLNLGG
ncbi:EamA family transporter [Actinopolymorpha singaporensis]|uniref:DMT family transporter n=1 Tax=Actinopolymorpha singaporensis TaxID=117157 RepID=UPI0018D3A530|nr:DMT family transporter [Actinopolymorpha singaporensis]